MLSLRAVATTDGATSLHNPVFVVGVITTLLVSRRETSMTSPRGPVRLPRTNATK